MPQSMNNNMKVASSRVPDFIRQHYDNPVLEFNRRIIEATKNHCIAYKFNIAFYEAHGVSGWKSLEKTINYINLIHEDIFVIADANKSSGGDNELHLFI